MDHAFIPSHAHVHTMYYSRKLFCLAHRLKQHKIHVVLVTVLLENISLPKMCPNFLVHAKLPFKQCFTVCYSIALLWHCAVVNAFCLLALNITQRLVTTNLVDARGQWQLIDGIWSFSGCATMQLEIFKGLKFWILIYPQKYKPQGLVLR